MYGLLRDIKEVYAVHLYAVIRMIICLYDGHHEGNDVGNLITGKQVARRNNYNKNSGDKVLLIYLKATKKHTPEFAFGNFRLV